MNIDIPKMNEHGIYHITGQISDDNVNPCIKWIIENNLVLPEKRLNELTLIITSPGGDLSPALALIDVMKGSRIPIHTVALGEVCSSACMIFMAGQKGRREVSRTARILSHEFRHHIEGTITVLEHYMVEMRKLKGSILNLYRECTGMSDKVIRKHLLTPLDQWLTPDAAVRYGVADKVIDSLTMYTDYKK